MCMLATFTHTHLLGQDNTTSNVTSCAAAHPTPLDTLLRMRTCHARPSHHPVRVPEDADIVSVSRTSVGTSRNKDRDCSLRVTRGSLPRPPRSDPGHPQAVTNVVKWSVWRQATCGPACPGSRGWVSLSRGQSPRLVPFPHWMSGTDMTKTVKEKPQFNRCEPPTYRRNKWAPGQAMGQ